MLSVPLTGTPALIAVVVGLGGVFVALSQMSRHSVLRILLLVTAFGAIAAGGALGLRDEAAALALGGKLFLGGVVLVCVGACVMVRRLVVSDRTLMRTITELEAAQEECQRLVADSQELKSQLENAAFELRKRDRAAERVGGADTSQLQTRIDLAEQELRQSHSLGDELFDAIAVLDPETLRVGTFNAALCRMTGRGRAELEGVALEELLDAGPEIMRSFDLRQAAHAGNSVIVPLQTHADGQREIELRVGRAGEGAEARVVAVLRDVTRESALSAEVRDLHDRIGELERQAAYHVCTPAPGDSTQPLASPSISTDSLEDLVAREAEWISETLPAQQTVSHEHSVEAVAHDLRVPLTSIRSFSEILLEHEDVSGDERAEFLHIIRNESDRLSRMVEDLLVVRKVKSGAGELELSDVDMRDLVRAAIHSLDGLARSRGIEFEGTWDREPSLVRGDGDRLHRMVANLLSNAINFSPENGAVEIILRDGSEEGAVLLGVRDHGPGIAEEDQAIVFERFSRGAKGSENVSGTGLGLSICREIVDVHGARIWPESRPQSGATLWVEFPPPDRVGIPAVEADAPAAV